MSSRKIKLRVWDNHGQNWVDTFRAAMRLSGGYIIDSFNDQNPYWLEDGRFSPIMEYTGMNDVNGQEIYEGDLVQITTSTGGTVTGEIIMKDGCFVIQLNEPVRDPEGFYRTHDYVKVYVANHVIRVIGNIYQNPELLQQ